MPRGETADPRIPDACAWPGLPAPERERRQLILDEIRRRIAEEGPRTAWDHPDRARQFMPFDALKGYGAMVDEALREGEGAHGDPGVRPERGESAPT